MHVACDKIFFGSPAKVGWRNKKKKPAVVEKKNFCCRQASMLQQQQRRAGRETSPASTMAHESNCPPQAPPLGAAAPALPSGAAQQSQSLLQHQQRAPRQESQAQAQQETKCSAPRCTKPLEATTRCGKEGCTKKLRATRCSAMLQKHELEQLVDPVNEETLHACGKTCCKHLEGTFARAPTSRAPWANDGRNGPSDPSHSLGLLLEWLFAEGNCSACRGSSKNGTPKMQFCAQLPKGIAGNGCRVVRTPEGVKKKIEEIERKFIDAHDWAGAAGKGALVIQVHILPEQASIAQRGLC